MEVSTDSSAYQQGRPVLIRKRSDRSSFQEWKIFIVLVAGVLAFLFVVFSFMMGVLFINLFSQKPITGTQITQYEVAAGFPQSAKQYLPIYQEAGEQYGVPWHILAAIHKVETDFGRNLSVSSVGATGHTQFMDKTWVGWSYPGGTKLGDLPDNIDITDPALIKKYGGYGVDANGDGKADPYDPVDAIHATAKYLAANHQPGDDWFARRGAVWQYNHDYDNYVLKVKKYSETFASPVVTVSGSRYATGQFVWPVPGGTLTSSFGTRFHPLKKVYQEHHGIDIGKELGAPIVASDGGIVVESRAASGYGWIIVLDHGNGYRTLYAHMEEKDVNVEVGEQVAQGQVIALMGSNGWSTGPHLHFEIRKDGQLLDPEKLVLSP